MDEKTKELLPAPTRFPELNKILERLVQGSRDCLEGNLAAVYLQGSFALGEADEYSDVDFLVLTNDEVTEDQLRALQQMHAGLHDVDVSWAQHLEGSYTPKDKFRRVDPERTPFLFLDNGASRLELDSHCNSAVVRWILRERGITLLGPEPKEMIDPVREEDLRREAMQALREYAEWAPEPTEAGPMSRWKQPYLVLTFCRILHTIENGHVATKRTAADWAAEHLDPRWRSLIEQAVADRPDPWARVHQRADVGLTNETLAFAQYALERGNSATT